MIEVAENDRHLSVHRGFFVVSFANNQVGQVALDDIGAVIANAHGLTYSNNLLVALAERGIPFVLCGDNHQCVGVLLTVDGNYQQAKRFDAQIAAKQPLKKRLWASIVSSKIAQQALVLKKAGYSSIPLEHMRTQIKSGDSTNLEAQAARYYWKQLFGPEFKRDRNASGINSLLNYGYTVLRAATARKVSVWS